MCRLAPRFSCSCFRSELLTSSKPLFGSMLEDDLHEAEIAMWPPDAASSIGGDKSRAVPKREQAATGTTRLLQAYIVQDKYSVVPRPSHPLPHVP